MERPPAVILPTGSENASTSENVWSVSSRYTFYNIFCD
jgi:hypothetical protein